MSSAALRGGRNVAAEVQIVLPDWNLANAARALATAALEREGSIKAAAKAMDITAFRLKKILGTGATRPPPASGKNVRRKDQGKKRKG